MSIKNDEYAATWDVVPEIRSATPEAALDPSDPMAQGWRDGESGIEERLASGTKLAADSWQVGVVKNQLKKDGYWDESRPAPAVAATASDTSVVDTIRAAKMRDDERSILDRMEMTRKTRPKLSEQDRRKEAREHLRL